MWKLRMHPASHKCAIFASIQWPLKLLAEQLVRTLSDPPSLRHIGYNYRAMRFTEPWYLLLLPVAWGWVWWTGRRLLGVSRARQAAMR